MRSKRSKAWHRRNHAVAVTRAILDAPYWRKYCFQHDQIYMVGCANCERDYYHMVSLDGRKELERKILKMQRPNHGQQAKVE